MIPILSDFTQVFNRSILLKITPLVSKKKLKNVNGYLKTMDAQNLTTGELLTHDFPLGPYSSYKKAFSCAF